MKTKFIFITGGVVSSLGKGINASSIGKLLKEHGLKVFMQKFDPYINVDPGNMSPLQHGEVFVTADGAETDLDLGHYERFIDVELDKNSSITTGKIYLSVIEKERKGLYGGKTIQVIPHITNEIKTRIINAAKTSGADVVICEIGGTVGDIESLPFLEAIRQLRKDVGYVNTLYVHNTLVPYLAASKELKTKPTQHSVKELRSLGINPDIIILRTEHYLSQNEKDKIALFCDVDKESVIEAIDCKSIYDVPLLLAKQNIDKVILKHFHLPAKELDLSNWRNFVLKVSSLEKRVKIALVGKYVNLKDAYFSVYESLKHAGYANDVIVETVPVDSGKITKENVESMLSSYAGIIVPGGFGSRDVEGILIAIEYARKHNVPFFGICFGLQLSLIEYARNVLGYSNANSKELDENTSMPLIDIKEQRVGIGNPMRLGNYPCKIKPNTLAYEIYKEDLIYERHRHRYEVNNKYLDIFDNSDLVFSGINEMDDIVEIIEVKNHPFFIACQFHPEFKSRPTRPSPIFKTFIKASITNIIAK